MKFGQYMGAPPSSINSELKLVDNQINKLWKDAKTDDDKIKALSFQHVRLVSIHGFKDGNGRTSRRALRFDFEYGIFDNRKMARTKIFEYIEIFYNTKRSYSYGRFAILCATRKIFE